MKIACPSCGAHGSIELFTADVDAREFGLLLSRLSGSFGPLVLSYLGLFRPGKRALAWPRARRLLEDLMPMIERAQVQRHGRAWAAPREAWREAMTQMLDRRERLQLPLANHGYLLEIIVGSQNRVEAAVEEQMEQRRQTASSARPQSAAQSLTDITQNLDTSPRTRAVAALAAEISRRREAGEAPLANKEMRKYQTEREREFSLPPSEPTGGEP